MLRYFKLKTAHSDLEFTNFQKNSEIFLKKCKKFSNIRLGRRWRAVIWLEHALLVAA
jgi:hypothetical protein